MQAGTGPVIWPDVSLLSEHWIECLRLAHVVYNRFDRAEFIVRRPTPVTRDGKDVRHVLHDSEVHRQHTIFCGDKRRR